MQRIKKTDPIKFRVYHRRSKRLIGWGEIMKGIENSAFTGHVSEYLFPDKEMDRRPTFEGAEFRSPTEGLYKVSLMDILVSKDLERNRFTGYVDKNGAEIYEGDLILWDHDTYEVQQMHGEWILWNMGDPPNDRPSLGKLITTSGNNVEVVGTIYDND